MCCALFVLVVQASAQLNNHTYIQCQTGSHIGWWTYYKGTTAAGEFLGNDHTRTVPTIVAELEINHVFKKYKLGFNTTYAWFMEYEMRAAKDAYLRNNEYRISNGNTMQYWQAGVSLGYVIINNSKWQHTAGLRLGSFKLASSHPQSDNFGFRYFYQPYISLSKKKNRFIYGIDVRYNQMNILPIKPINKGEHHTIIGFGATISLAYAIF
jgi:hypothetical protein